MDVSTNYRNSFAISLFTKMLAAVADFFVLKPNFMEVTYESESNFGAGKGRQAAAEIFHSLRDGSADQRVI